MQGEFKKNKKEGQGILKYVNGDIYYVLLNK